MFFLDVTEVIWWICFFIAVYTYVGYGILIYFLVLLKRVLKKSAIKQKPYSLPSLCIIVAAYNEEAFIEAKIHNTLNLDYPSEKIKYFFITDGSTDRTSDIVKKYPEVRHLHRPERKGKIAAVQRAMQFVDTQVVIFTDANTFLNKEAALLLVQPYRNPRIGVVAGEKRVHVKEKDSAAGAGEGFYWKYESLLKKWDAELYSVVGAAGELFSIQSDLYEAVPEDTIIEDFYMTLRIAQKGYKIAYEPAAFALESPSASVKEELKRKVRIAAGGIQAIVRLKSLLNPLKYGLLSFQYLSHRVLRWTLTPFSLIVLLLFNLLLISKLFFTFTFIIQFLFYVSALMGYFLEGKSIKVKVFFIPYYFVIMNLAVLRGMMKYLGGQQSVLWDRAKRAS